MKKHNLPGYISYDALVAIGAERGFTTRAAVKEYLSGDTLQCFLCDKSFPHLGVHVSVTHGVSAREYKRAFNLPRKHGLIGAALREHMRETALSNQINIARVSEMGRIYGVLNHEGNAPQSYPSWIGGNGPRKPKVNVGVNLGVSLDDLRAAIPPAEQLQSVNSFVGYDSQSLVARVERIEKTLRIIRFALEEHLK
jgi:ROS/MUCR transcriptional regulator protein